MYLPPGSVMPGLQSFPVDRKMKWLRRNKAATKLCRWYQVNYLSATWYIFFIYQVLIIAMSFYVRLSISSRSRGRPDSFLFFSKSLKPIKLTCKPSIVTSFRLAKHSLKVTPSISVSKSILSGGKPNWITFPGLMKSPGLSLNEEKPNSFTDFNISSAFCGVGFSQMSKSPVYRGCPCKPTHNRQQLNIQLCFWLIIL